MPSDKLHLCPISEQANDEQAPQLVTHTFKRAPAAFKVRMAECSCTSEKQNMLFCRRTTAADTVLDKWPSSFSVTPKTEPCTLLFAVAFLNAMTVWWSVLPSESWKPPRPLVRSRDCRTTPRPRPIDDRRGNRTQVEGDVARPASRKAATLTAAARAATPAAGKGMAPLAAKGRGASPAKQRATSSEKQLCGGELCKLPQRRELDSSSG